MSTYNRVVAANSSASLAPTVRERLATEMADPASEVGASLSGTFATTGEVRSAAATDGSDQTAVIQAELDALYAGGGGTLVLPIGTIVCAGTITLINDGTTPPKQPAITLRGQGTHWSGRGTAPVGGTLVDIQGTDTYGKIKTNGLGLLTIHAVTFRDTSGGSTPFIYTTNTTLHISGCSFVGSKAGVACDQDALILGGINQIEGGSGWADGFQGYGTIIANSFFSGIRTAIKGQAFANAVVVRENTIWTTCGNPNGAAIEWDGRPTTGSQYAAGCVIIGNLIELPNYKYGIRLAQCAAFNITANNLYDSTATTAAGYYLDATSATNVVYEGYTSINPAFVDPSSTNWFYAVTQGVLSALPPARFLDDNYATEFRKILISSGDSQFVVQPAEAQSDSSMTQIIKRSALEATNPGAEIWHMQQNGAVRFDPTAAMSGNVVGPYTEWSAGGRYWSGVGTAAGQANGSQMTQDSGPGGSYFDLRNYGVRFYDHNDGPLRAIVGAGVDGIKLGSASDAVVQRAAAGVVDVGKLAVGNSAPATTPGSVAKKIEVFDASGTSLGFVAVYSSIT